ncbi:hypothetical protein LEMLEM_LOCUS25336 [Lemmus lemmus]
MENHSPSPRPFFPREHWSAFYSNNPREVDQMSDSHKQRRSRRSQRTSCHLWHMSQLDKCFVERENEH